jgi:hypothetical protein
MPGVQLPLYYGYPVYAIAAEPADKGPEQRIENLKQLFDAYRSADGNNAVPRSTETLQVSTSPQRQTLSYLCSIRGSTA